MMSERNSTNNDFPLPPGLSQRIYMQDCKLEVELTAHSPR
ncbi:hypothetical protein SAMN05444371_3478 [Epilithonimonas mollis]|uniref:Uncharacterized protein n=1 Tax=Epilithonimonas mollis TaxID=216903 RepID=A0A1M6UV23_9FLAO|nr:hypothetical protein SAMN05444371_3478 [Epilithonimonas mollis]